MCTGMGHRVPENRAFSTLTESRVSGIVRQNAVRLV